MENLREITQPITHPVAIMKIERSRLAYPFNSDRFVSIWKQWKQYRKEEHGFTYKSPRSEQAALKKLGGMAKGLEDNAVAIIEESMANGWKGFFELKVKKDDGQISDSGREEILRASGLI